MIPQPSGRSGGAQTLAVRAPGSPYRPCHSQIWLSPYLVNLDVA
jgi:hypothetical protein